MGHFGQTGGGGSGSALGVAAEWQRGGSGGGRGLGWAASAIEAVSGAGARNPVRSAP
jgi:hypothetical protein